MAIEDKKDLGEIVLPSGWSNPPKLTDLQQNYQDAKSAHDTEQVKRDSYRDHIEMTGSAALPKRKGYSGIQPRLIRKAAEWRYSALTEAILSMEHIYSLQPRTHADQLAAHQNQTLLNYQWDNVLNKVSIVDTLVRTLVDEGTVFVRVGWVTEEQEVEEEVPIYDFFPATDQEQVATLMEYASWQQRDAEAAKEVIPEQFQQALQLTEQTGIPIFPTFKEMVITTKLDLVRNEPSITVCNSDNCYPDPTCQGDIDKAQFFVYSFETTRSELQRQGLYFNLDKLGNTEQDVIAHPNHTASYDDAFTFKDEPRVVLVAHEYWGAWDVDGSGITTPIVATWVGDVLIRLDVNPYPDQKIPFVSAQYLPIRHTLYGEPDGALLKDHQAIVGAVTRGCVDLLARSANAQEGIQEEALDAVNLRKFEAGERYRFRQGVDPRMAIFQHTYPEIPASAINIIQMMEAEANALIGTRPFGVTDSSAGTAVADRGVLDAASKRENGILRRLSKLMTLIGRKVIAMNGAFLADEEVIRVTDDSFIAIRREDLAGNYDVDVNISSAESDDRKAQELSFLLQTLGNTVPFEFTQLVLGEIARLRKMHKLAFRLENYTPEPDPQAAQEAQLRLENLMLENAQLRANIGNTEADAYLKQARAQEAFARGGNIQSDTDNKNLAFLNKESGRDHTEAVERQQAQAMGNMALEILKANLLKDQPKGDM